MKSYIELTWKIVQFYKWNILEKPLKKRILLE